MKTEKRIEDYLPYYIGCDVEYYDINNNVRRDILTWRLLEFAGAFKIKPILRPLSSMTEQEKLEYNKLSWHGTDGVHAIIVSSDTPESFRYLLSKHFDIFNLHEASLCLFEEELKWKER